MKINPALTEIITTIKDAEKVVLACHIFPDADALGSQLALGNILRSMGKEVYLYGEEAASYILDFLPGSETIDVGLPEINHYDCCIALDCGDERRLGKEKKQLLQIHPFIVLDHHSGHKNFGDLRWVESGKSSTGEMVFELAKAMGSEISYETAYCLYAAIVSDTGSFKYASTAPSTLRVAGELVELGVRPAEISGKIFDNFTKNRLQLLQEVLASLALYENDKLAIIEVTLELYEKTGTTGVDTEHFINYPRALETVKVAAFIKESKDFIGVSMRSKGSYDVAQVARKFDGGGHRNAAGFKLPTTGTAEGRDQVVAEIRGQVVAELSALLS